MQGAKSFRHHGWRKLAIRLASEPIRATPEFTGMRNITKGWVVFEECGGFSVGLPSGVHTIASVMPWPDARQNAHLIAAVPELLAALKEEHLWNEPAHRRAMPNCASCAAIAKAEGGES